MMRVAKLEPHIVQPVVDGTDIDLFLNEVEEDARQAQPIASGAEAEVRPEQQNLTPFLEFLNRHKKSNPKFAPKSKIGIALNRYETQKSAVITEDEKEIAELAVFKKYA